MTKKIITIDGMHCSHCASAVEKAIGEIDGVKSAKVDLEKKICTAKLDKEISDDTLEEAVKDAGFEFIRVETKKGLF